MMRALGCCGPRPAHGTSASSVPPHAVRMPEIAAARPPGAERSAAISQPAMSTPMTRAPSRSSRERNALPSPEAAPVTATPPPLTVFAPPRALCPSQAQQLFAQLVLRHLAAGVARHHIDDHHALGDLLVHEPHT